MVDDSEATDAALLPDTGAVPVAPRPDALAALARAVAHDLNNLLGVILNYATLLERQMAEPVALADLAQIRTAAERATGLTRQLLGLARRLDPDRSGVDLNACLGEVIARNHDVLPGDVFMSVALSGEPLHVVTEARELEEVLTALVTSAYQAITGHGSIAVTTRPVLEASAWHPARVAVVSVTDNGTGRRAAVAAGSAGVQFTATERLVSADGTSTAVSVAFPLAP